MFITPISMTCAVVRQRGLDGWRAFDVAAPSKAINIQDKFAKPLTMLTEYSGLLQRAPAHLAGQCQCCHGTKQQGSEGGVQ